MQTSSLESGRPPRIQILGISFDLIDIDSAVESVNQCVKARANGRYVCACPVHPLMLSQTDDELRLALNSSWMTVPDGMPVAWAARLLGWPIEKNIRGTTLMLRLCELAKRQNYSIFVYGSEQETLWELITHLLEKFPGLRIAGYHSPPFRKLEPDEESRIINIINSRSVDILFVGLGAPKQEKWMASLCPRLSVPVTVGVGAAFDFLSGTKPEAPLWVQSHGLEWLFRLICEPKRLIGRYAVFNSKFAYWLAKQFLVTNSGKVARKIYSSRPDL